MHRSPRQCIPPCPHISIDRVRQSDFCALGLIVRVFHPDLEQQTDLFLVPFVDPAKRQFAQRLSLRWINTHLLDLRLRSIQQRNQKQR